MKLIEQTQKDKDIYNHFVMSQPGGSFLQSFEWGQWQRSLGREVYRFFISQDGHMVGSVQVIIMPIGLGRCYLYIPYGPVVRSNAVIGAKELGVLLRLKFPKAVFLRLEPTEPIKDLQEAGKKVINIQPAVTMVVNLGKQDEELLAGMHNKTRYNIRVAQKHGVEVRAVESREDMSDAIDLIIETQNRQKYKGHSKDYYQKLLEFFLPNNSSSALKVSVWEAEYQKKILACGVMVDYGKTRMYLYGGSSPDHRNVMAPYLLHWASMGDARSKGLDFYDLGGSEVASGGEKGFTRFKQGFGGQIVEYKGAYDIVYQRLWYSLYGIMRTANRLLRKKNK